MLAHTCVELILQLFGFYNLPLLTGGFLVVPALLAPQRDQHEFRQPYLQENDRRSVHVGEEPVPTGQGVSYVHRRRGKLQRYHLKKKKLFSLLK
jgi:hypothetical protein